MRLLALAVLAGFIWLREGAAGFTWVLSMG
jgi:hypothetical protein